MNNQENKNSLLNKIANGFKVLGVSISKGAKRAAAGTGLWLKHSWQNISNKLIENGFFGNGKMIVMFTAILSLYLVNVHVSAINLLTNQYIGVLLLCFILFGLVSLFNSSRTKNTHDFAFYMTLFVIALTIGFGVKVNLIINSEYASVKANSPEKFSNITREQILTYICIGLYAIGFISILASKFLKKKQLEDNVCKVKTINQ